MRRKSPRVAWLPTTNAASVDNAGRSNWSTFIINADTTIGVGTRTLAEIPVLIDGVDPLAAANTIADAQNSGYRLRRIVGKIFVAALSQANAGNGWTAMGVTAGFIIRRTDPQNGTSLASAGALSNDTIDPAGNENVGDPWIWHRSWLLQNPSVALDPGADWLQSGQIAATNFVHGPAAVDGPHIDQKTARIVSAEERLFLDVGATILAGNIGAQADVRVFYQLRVLGSMRTTMGNRRNASR